MKRIAPEWAEILRRCGVRAVTAETWSEIFACTVDEDTFSAGDVDLKNFLAQVLHESAMLERLEEGLSYSAERLCAVWPRRFASLEAARPFARNPQALANRVYGGRMGNVDPDDGWKYRGRGLIQCTGRANYGLVESITGLPVLDQPELLAQPLEALQSAIAWWERAISDAILGDVERVSRAVNGGTAGLPDRIALTERAGEALA